MVREKKSQSEMTKFWMCDNIFERLQNNISLISERKWELCCSLMWCVCGYKGEEGFQRYSAGSGSMFPGSGNRKNLYHPFRLLRCDSVLYTRCIKRTWWKCKEEVHLDSFCLFYYPSFYYFFKWMLNRWDLNQAALDHIKSYISFFFLLTLTSCVFFGKKKKSKTFPGVFTTQLAREYPRYCCSSTLERTLSS